MGPLTTYYDYYKDNRVDMMSIEHTQRPPRGQGNLLSPPDQAADSFSHDTTMEVEGKTKLPPLRTLSPPISPRHASPQHRNPSPAVHHPSPHLWPMQDAPLFPANAHDDTTSTSRAPLFDTQRSSQSSHGDSPSGSPDQIEVDWDHREISQFGIGVFWRERKRAYAEFLTRGPKKDLPKPSPSATAAERDEISERQLRRLNGSAGITKPKALPKPALKSRVAKTTTSPVKTEMHVRPLKRTPKERVLHSFDEQLSPPSSTSPSSQPKHKRAAPTKSLKNPEKNDARWRELPDYCPPLDSLKTAAKPLKANWKNSPRDISGEPDFDQLDAREADAASELRLFPQQYLANKRRLFDARVEALRSGKHFNKTLAQAAMSIDVNKASRMWEMFDRVGWLDERWFERYL